MNLSFYAADGDITSVLVDLSLAVRQGEFTALIGPSGCGKTTLLNILAGLETQASGLVSLAGAPPHPGRPEIGFGPARDCLLPWRQALDNAALALELQGVHRKERHDRARVALQAMGLAASEHLYPAQLSQGMRQRVALARLFAGSPQILLLDEPFSALDAQTRVLVQDAFLRVWEQEHSSVLMVTHDLGEAITLADRVVVLTHRPAKVKATYDIELPRPRMAMTMRQHPEFHRTYESIWRDLKEEVDAHESAVLRSIGGLQ